MTDNNSPDNTTNAIPNVSETLIPEPTEQMLAPAGAQPANMSDANAVRIAPESRPADYQLPRIDNVPGAGGEYNADWMKFDVALRSSLSETGFDKPTGSALATGLIESIGQLRSMEPTERKIWEVEQDALLRKVWGSKADAKNAQVDAFLDWAPKLKACLKDGAHKSATVRFYLATHAELLHSRLARGK